MSESLEYLMGYYVDLGIKTCGWRLERIEIAGHPLDGVVSLMLFWRGHPFPSIVWATKNSPQTSTAKQLFEYFPCHIINKSVPATVDKNKSRITISNITSEAIPMKLSELEGIAYLTSISIDAPSNGFVGFRLEGRLDTRKKTKE